MVLSTPTSWSCVSRITPSWRDSNPATRGTGKNEPLLFAIAFGNGRVFHSALGHNNGPDLTSQKCVGFITTLLRGTEWAATGKVTIPIPADFPTATSVRSRE